MDAVILAGGQGKRLRPLTCDIPESLVPFFDRPLLAWQMEWLKAHGVGQAYVTIGYLPQMFTKCLGDAAASDIPVEWVLEDHPLGTAGSVKQLQKQLRKTFIVTGGDAITQMDLTKALAMHRIHHAKVTVLVKHVMEPVHYGVVVMDEEHRITRLDEKPDWTHVCADTVSTGIYIMEPEVLHWIPEQHPFDFEKDLFPLLLQRGIPMYAAPMHGYWRGIRQVADYRQAHKDVLDGKCPLAIGEQIQPGIFLAQGMERPSGVELRAPVYIGKHTTIEPDVSLGPYAVVGKHCTLQASASARDSILWQHSQLGPRSELRGAVCCDNVILERDVRIFEEAVIGRKTTIGFGSTIAQRVKVWPEKHILPHSHITHHLVHQPSIATDVGGGFLLTPLDAFHIAQAVRSSLGSEDWSLLGGEEDAVVACYKTLLLQALRLQGANVTDAGTSSMEAFWFAMQQTPYRTAVYVMRNAKGEVHVRLFTAHTEGWQAWTEPSLQLALEQAPAAGTLHDLGQQKAGNAAQAYASFLRKHYGMPKHLRILVQGPKSRALMQTLSQTGCQTRWVSAAKVDTLHRRMQEHTCALGLWLPTEPHMEPVWMDAQGNKLDVGKIRRVLQTPTDAPLPLMQILFLLGSLAPARWAMFMEEPDERADIRLNAQAPQQQWMRILHELVQQEGAHWKVGGVEMEKETATLSVSPDPRAHALRIQSRAFSQEIAQQWAEDIQKKIEQFCQ